MAKKKTNKSAAIRKYLEDHADAPNSEVVTELKKDGVTVTSTYVSNVKSTSNLGGTRKKKRRKKTVSKKTAETTPVQDVAKAGELMLQAVNLVTNAGYREAQALVKMAGDFVRGK